MIDLTPLDVRKKRDDFKRTIRGYDPAQVDAFLEIVSDRLEQLVREHGTLSDQAAHMQKQLETYQERERALNEALLAAQELREEARSQSERDAAVRLREAETHAEAILLDADQAIRHSGRRLDDLRTRRRHFLKSLRSVLDRFEDHLELEESRLETEPEDLGDLLERLDKDLGPSDADAGRPESHAADAGEPEQASEPTVSDVDDLADASGEDDGHTIVGAGGADGAPDATGDEVAADDVTDDPTHLAETLTDPSANGQSEDIAQHVTDAVEEADSGSRLATPHLITPTDAGGPGPSTN
ncbi:MAG: DivIVA domain-containing protein [Gemmatimonadota bacterium]